MDNYKYKFRDYAKSVWGSCIKIFIEVIIENKETKEEYIMKQEVKTLPLPPLDVPCAYVNVKVGATVPIPQKRYHMARIDIGLSYPCHPEIIDDVFEKVSDWVDKRMKKEYNELIQEDNTPIDKDLEIL